MAGLDINIIRAKQAELKASIAKDVEQIEEANHVKKLEVENANCMASLLLAQNTIMELTDYLDRGMQAVNAQVARLETSNETVKGTLQVEISNLQKDSAKIMQAIGDDARKQVAASLEQLDKDLQAVSQRHKAIAANLESNLTDTQQWTNLTFVGTFLWRWSVFMMLCALVKQELQVGIFGLLKIWLAGLI